MEECFCDQASEYCEFVVEAGLKLSFNFYSISSILNIVVVLLGLDHCDVAVLEFSSTLVVFNLAYLLSRR